MLTIDQIYYTSILTFNFIYITLSLIPMEEKYMRKYYNFCHNKIGVNYDDFDWKKTLMGEKRFFNTIQIYLTCFFILSKIVGEWNGKLIIGEWIAKIGLLSCCVLALILSCSANRVRK